MVVRPLASQKWEKKSPSRYGKKAHTHTHYTWKILKLWRLPNMECSLLKDSVHPIWPSYIGERRTTFAKAYGIKVSCYGDHVGEHIGNLGKILGTWWEPTGNFKWTHWEQGENEKKQKKNSFPTTPTQNLKGRKARHLECMRGPSNWLHEISLPRRVHHHFWPGLIPLAKNTLPIHLIHNWKQTKHPMKPKATHRYSLQILI